MALVDQPPGPEQAIETLLAEHSSSGVFCHGDRPTIADICLVTQVTPAKTFDLPLDPYPRVMRIYAHLHSHPCFRRCPSGKAARRGVGELRTLPGSRIGEVFPRLSPLFPEAVAAPNVLYTGFTNANAMLHVANCVANAGRIESGDSYNFYAEGVTPAVVRLYEAINAERVAVAAALGAPVPTLADWFERVYGVRRATLVETCQRLTYKSDGPYQATGTPKSLDHKFITEDVPTGLIPMSALGAATGVNTPAIDALVEVVRNITGRDFAGEGRTLECLGLNGMDGPQVRRVMEEGFS